MEGIIPLYKPKGMTSHDCVFKLRKILKMKRIGHTGTLDPDVTGVLPICIGRATKVAEYITDAGKVYEGEVTVGVATTTEDASGEIIAKKPIERNITLNEIQDIFNQLTGSITQTPPMYSAVKVNGKKLYEYARQGIEVERPSRTVQIYSLELLNTPIYHSNETVSFRFSVACSKGTYIRTLAVTIGELMGYPAHMSDLCRIQSASFSLKDCVTFEDIERKSDNGELADILYPIETALTHLPKHIINDKMAEKVKNGAILSIPDSLLEEKNSIVMETQDGHAIAIYMHHPKKPGLMKPAKVF